jgi:hypothetical protein
LPRQFAPTLVAALIVASGRPAATSNSMSRCMLMPVTVSHLSR